MGRSYDGNGNLLTATITTTAGTTTTTYGYAPNVAPNEVLTVTTPGQPTTYGYDAHGDTTAITTTSAITSLRYDRQARLVTVTLPNGTTIGLSYNAAGQRAGYVQDLSWFQLQDNPGILNGTSWGLLDRSGSPKPAFKEFQGQ